MTAAGALAERASAVYRGKDPRPMDDPKFWLSAVARGGSLGPLGDFLYASENRFGNSLIPALAGPVGGELESAFKLTAGNLSELVREGEAQKVGTALVNFAEGLLPGNSSEESRCGKGCGRTLRSRW